LTIKDLWEKGKYKIVMKNAKGREDGSLEFSVAGKEGGKDD
jgi:hypothetical protein